MLPGYAEASAVREAFWQIAEDDLVLLGFGQLSGLQPMTVGADRRRQVNSLRAPVSVV